MWQNQHCLPRPQVRSARVGGGRDEEEGLGGIQDYQGVRRVQQVKIQDSVR
jgi:hypothetical protein